MEHAKVGRSLGWLTRGMPLGSQLALCGIGFLVPVLLFVAVLVVRLAEQDRRDALQRLDHAAGLLAQATEREISSTQRVLQSLAQSTQLQSDHLDAFDTEARRVQATQPGWMAVVLLDRTGKQLVNTLRPRGARLPTVLEAATYRDVLRTGQPTVSPATRTRVGKWGFGVRIPVKRNGAVRYVLTAALSTEGLSGVVATNLLLHQEWTRTIVDDRGVILARSRAPEQFVGHTATPRYLQQIRSRTSGTFRNVSLDGAVVYAGFCRVRPWNWTAGIGTPVETVDGPMHRTLLAAGGLGAGIIFLTAAGAFLFSRRLSRELTAAAQAAVTLAGGGAPRSFTSSVREISLLGLALERSARLLREREQGQREHLAQAEAARREAEAARAEAEVARGEAEASNRSKDEFLALLGHELRNPLSPIVTTLHLVQARGEMRPRDLEVLLRQSRHVSRLVDDLLDVSRIMRGAIVLKREPLEIEEVVDTATEMVSPLIQDRRHRLEVQVPPSGLKVWGDRVRLAQVVSNLLTNAARYTPEGGTITVAARQQEQHVELTVTDNGVGLTPELAPRLFEMFVQGPRGIDRNEGGLGLGLAIVRSLVGLHDGIVEAQSEGPGKGSTFRVRLPADDTPSDEA